MATDPPAAFTVVVEPTTLGTIPMAYIVRIIDRAGGATWLAREGPDGERVFGLRKGAEVFQVREEAQIASAKAAQSDGRPGMVFSVESAP
jgi:hypothetical protein